MARMRSRSARKLTANAEPQPAVEVPARRRRAGRLWQPHGREQDGDGRLREHMLGLHLHPDVVDRTVVVAGRHGDAVFAVDEDDAAVVVTTGGHHGQCQLLIADVLPSLLMSIDFFALWRSGAVSSRCVHRTPGTRSS